MIGPLIHILLIISFLFASPARVHAGGTDNADLFTKTVVFYDDTANLRFVSNTRLFEEGWDQLPQPRFWHEIISLSPDSVMINLAENRMVLQRIPRDNWHCQQENEKECYREYIRRANGLTEDASLYITSGKREFYEFKKVVPMIDRAIPLFMAEGVDPWFAQTILLIESPGKLHQRSSAGAFGPFQLMRSVARKYGLVVNRYTDERSDFDKSARASARLLGTICVPKTKELLDTLGLDYREDDLWFRLLVMHTYHAGAANVRCMLEKLQPREGGQALFQKIWTTECRGFKNESQNYSQIALASLMHFNDLITESKDTAYMVTGDVMMRNFHAGLMPYEASVGYLRSCIEAYESDLVDGVIPFEYFHEKMTAVNKQLSFTELKNPEKPAPVLASFPLTTDRFIHIGDQLMRRKQVDEAIKVYKLNVEHNPSSPAAYDSLGRAYKKIGQEELAVKYLNKSESLRGGKP